MSLLRQLAPALFDTGDLVIRTPKRGAGYAAQVWGRGGFWLLGVHPTIPAARDACRRFLATDPVEPPLGASRDALPANWVRKRSDGHRPHHKWVRRVKGSAYQGRVWGGPKCGCINLGLFTVHDHGDMAEWAAAQVAKAFMREWRDGRTVGQVIAMLKNAPRRSDRVPEHVEPPPHQRDLPPPTSFGPMEDAEERRERERAARIARQEKRYRLDLFGRPVRERLPEAA